MKQLFGTNLEDEYGMQRKGDKAEHEYYKNVVISSLYQNLMWENKFTCWPDGRALILAPGSHEKRLYEEGWDRSPSPQESFVLLMDWYSGKLKNNLKQATKNMIESSGEFTSTLAKYIDNRLIMLEHFMGYNKLFGSDQIASVDIRFSETKFFNIVDVETENYTPIKNIYIINPDLVDHLFGIPYNYLPPEIKAEEIQPMLKLPQGNGWYVMIRGDYNRPFNLSFNNNNCCSRGVKLL